MFTLERETHRIERIKSFGERQGQNTSCVRDSLVWTKTLSECGREEKLGVVRERFIYTSLISRHQNHGSQFNLLSMFHFAYRFWIKRSPQNMRAWISLVKDSTSTQHVC
jgi:hypothetical protein